MKANIKTTKEVDVKYFVIDTNVFYWEDTEVNGTDDIDFGQTEGEGEPRMPGAYRIMDKPTDHLMSNHFRWSITIDVETGKVLDWPVGTTARVHYKICDEGTYALLDENKQEIIKVESYVPDCIGECGDYIILIIDENGQIANFSFTSKDVNSIIENAF